VSDVRVRVVAFQISDAIDVADVRVLPANDQIVDGNDAIAEASDVDAASTVLLVFELTEAVPAVTSD
jgi:hypothetical protein